MKKEYINRISIGLSAISQNESVARSLVAVSVAPLDPTASELADIRCAVSEAVTNAIVHGYKNGGGIYAGAAAPIVYISVTLYRESVVVEVKDKGIGIADIKKAREPLFTTDETGERSGMGFAVMEAFMDEVRVFSTPGKGTRVVLRKTLGGKEDGSALAE